MKKYLLPTALLALATVTAPALPLYEPFDYAFSPPNTNLVGKTSPDGITWTQAGPTNGGTNVPSVNAGSLTYPGLAPSIGNSVKFGGIDSTGMGVRFSLPTTLTSGTVYYSFVLQLTDITGLGSGGIFWAGFNNTPGSQSNIPNVVGTRVYTRSSGAGFNLGVAKNNSTDIAWDTAERNVGDTIFVVGAYTIVNGIVSSGSTDDIAEMWINPDSSTFGAASPPAATLTASTGADMTSTANPPGIASFVIYNRNASEPHGIVLDELLISTNWADVTPLVPAITSQPQSQRSLVGNAVTFNVSAYKVAGYQWRYYGTNRPGANGSSLTINNAQVADSGPYTVVATNGATSITSTVANLTIVADIYPRLRPLWSIPPGTPDYPYVTADDSNTPNLRSIAYNALSNQVLVVSRTNYLTGATTPAIYVLDASTGANLYSLDTSVVAGGNLTLNCIDVADDGAVYAANLSTSASGNNLFSLYRWPDSGGSTAGALVFQGEPEGLSASPRWGDTLRARGTNVNTEVIADSNDGSWFVVFKPTDSSMSSFANLIAHTNYLGTGSIGRSLQFGNSTNFWAKRKGASLQLATYDSTAFSPVNVNADFSNFPSTVGPVGFNPSAQTNLLCGIDFVSGSSTPDTLDLFEVSDLSTPLLLAKYGFPTNHQANANFVGQVRFAGTNVYAVDANNGIAAFTWVPFRPPLNIVQSGSDVLVFWVTNATGYTLYSTPSLTSPITWHSLGTGTIVGGDYVVTNAVSSAPQFYRLQE